MITLNRSTSVGLGSLILFGMVFTSCMDSYDRDAIGHYRVAQYKLNDSSSVQYLPTLDLNKDKTFIIKYPNKEIKGSWDIETYGDFELIYFKSDVPAQGRVSFHMDGEIIINIETGYSNYFPAFDNISFRKLSQ